MKSSSFLLLASLAFASLQTISAASFPTTSLNSNAALLKSRQAKRKDVVRRMKAGPRRRADPSVVPCSEPLNTEKIINGDFSSPSSGAVGPWTFSGEGNAYADLLRVSCTSPSGTCVSLSAGVSSGPGSFVLSQPVSTCVGAYYVVKYTIGTDRSASACAVSISIGDGTTAGTRILKSDPGYCTENFCTINANGYYTFYGRGTAFTAVAGDSVLSYSITCDPASSSGANSGFEIDDLSMVRSVAGD